MTTYLWHDYETWGVNPRRDRPAQFAAIRTDMDLNEVGQPLMLYCQPPMDALPSPQACLITGITPQLCAQKGLPEFEFAAQVEAALGQPGTIGVGYNSIRFDDEVTRFMLWRNLRDAYAREWQHDCSRWDLLDVVRLAHALRPDGIHWPTAATEPGKPEKTPKPSFKLTDLTAANGIAHVGAHDALADVRATIALARLLKKAQPKLFDFALALRKKDRVAAELGLPASPQNAKPFLHVSGMFPPERGCLALMWPLATHPSNKNEVLAWDLAHNPSQLANISAAEIRERLFTKTEDLPEGVERLPIKSVHLNKSPMVVGNLATLTPAMAQRWGIDKDLALLHAAMARDLPDLSGIWPQVFTREKNGPTDVDEDLYGGFLGNADRRRLDGLRGLDGPVLAKTKSAFDDARLEEMVFRYRARNWPQSLNTEEQTRWQDHIAARFFEGEGGATTVDAYFAEIDTLSETANDRAEEILGALYDWAEVVVPER